jgi:hypothetical protein
LRKLEGYLRLAAAWTEDQGLTGFPNLLIIVPEKVRKGGVGLALRHAIGRLHIGGSLATLFPIYVAAEDVLVELGVLAPAWIHLPTESDRLSLLDLPVRPGEPYRTIPCLGQYFTDAHGARRRRRISPDSTPPRFPVVPPWLPP